MPRPLRLHLAGGFYHVTLRGNHRQKLFALDADRFLLNAIVEFALQKYAARLHAYCWMTNHIHMLVQVGDEPLTALMRHIAAGYARAFQRKLETTGHLFERRYHAILVDADCYLLELLRYIHLNPVRAGIARAPQEYRWSSHHAYIGAPTDSFVTTGFALNLFSRDHARAMNAYRVFMNCDALQIPSPLDEVRGESPHILGSDDFIRRVSARPVRPDSQATLDSLLADACKRFHLDRPQLRGVGRNPTIAAARAWIASEASRRGIATLAAIARELGCDRNTLRLAMRRFSSNES